MMRKFYHWFFIVLAGLTMLGAYRFSAPIALGKPCPVNTTLALVASEGKPVAPFAAFPALTERNADGPLKVLFLHYSAYDTAYALKLEHFIVQNMDNLHTTRFWHGTTAQLEQALSTRHVVVIGYPSKGKPYELQAYGKVLAEFVRQGGAVVFTGTHEFGILQHYNLFDLDFGYYASGMAVHEQYSAHPLLQGTPTDFVPTHYTYPLDVSDPNFVSLAEVRGYPVVGYKSTGAGKVIYIGLEYYFDDPASTDILINALRWATPAGVGTTAASTTPTKPTANTSISRVPVVQRSEENFTAGSGSIDPFRVKVFPNPYVEKASLEFELTKTTLVSIEITAENGQLATVLWSRKPLNAGSYRFEVPGLPVGIYFIKCTMGDYSTVRKIVKV
jgi:Secretion system C-terminal sorting domain